ncbi:hypothetical protein SAMN04244553_3839 [Nocardia amikacinitolerans]|uniref:Uncharacterized protein n=2 Tax=Nocardia amikacinitolerans TaxID=756689 RepID=A0A285LTC8_9NOCA|nr:hypothetical protein SAMN04244553_3839 [Nocardia amikacinitolerans]
MEREMSDPHGDGFSEFAEELKLLAEAVLERVEPVLRRSATQGQPDWSACSWCPVCAAAALVRGEHHDVVAAIADHGTAIVTVLREALAGVPVDPLLPDDEDSENGVRHRHPGAGPRSAARHGAGDGSSRAGAARQPGDRRTGPGDRHDAEDLSGGRGTDASRAGDQHAAGHRSGGQGMGASGDGDRRAAGHRSDARSTDASQGGERHDAGARSGGPDTDTSRAGDRHGAEGGRGAGQRLGHQRMGSADRHEVGSVSGGRGTDSRRDGDGHGNAARSSGTQVPPGRRDNTEGDVRAEASRADNERGDSSPSTDASPDQRTTAPLSSDAHSAKRPAGSKRSGYVGIPVTIKA